MLSSVATYGIGAVAMRLIWILLVPLYTRSFSPSGYGRIELVSTATNFLALIVMLGMDTAVWRYYFAADTPEQRRLVASTGYLMAIICVSLMACVLIIWSVPVAAIMLGSSRLSSTITWAAISLVGTTVLTCCTNFLRQKFAASLFNLAAIAQLLFSACATVLFLRVWHFGLPGVYAAQACGALSTIALVLPGLRRDLTPRVSPPLARQLLRFGLPLVPASVAAWTMSLADRVFIAHYRTQAELGFYGVANKVSAALLLGVTAFTLAWGPFALSISKRDDAGTTYATVLRHYVVAALTGALTITAFAPVILLVFAPPTYLAGYPVVAPLTLSLVALGAYSIVSIGVTLANRTQHIAVTQGSAAVVHLGLNFALIPGWGMGGAALSTLLSLYLAAQLLYFESQRLHRIPYQWRVLLLACGVAVVLSAAVTALQPSILGLDPALATLARLAVPALFVAACLVVRAIEPREVLAFVTQGRKSNGAIAMLMERSLRIVKLPGHVGSAPRGRILVSLACLIAAALFGAATVTLGMTALALPLTAIVLLLFLPRRRWWAPTLVIMLLLLHFALNTSLYVGGVNFFVVDLILLGLLAVVVFDTLTLGQCATLAGTPLNWLMIAFCADLIVSAVVGLAHGHDVKSVLNGSKEILYFTPFFLAPRLLRDGTDMRRLLAVVLGCAGVAGVYDIFNRATGIGYYPYSAASIQVTLTTGIVNRAYGLVTAPPFYLIATMFALVVLALAPLSRVQRQLLLIYTMVIIVLTLILLIRGLFVGLVVGLVVLGILCHGPARVRLIRYGALAVVALVLAGTAISIGGTSGLGSLQQRFLSIVVTDASTSQAADTRQQRLDYVFRTYSDVAAEGSQFLGRGLGFSPNEALYTSNNQEVFDEVLNYHSFVGWLIRNCGLLGLAIYVLLIGAYFSGGLRTLRTLHRLPDRVIVTGSLAAMAALLATSLAENYALQYPFTVPFTALLLAIPTIVAARRADEARRADATPSIGRFADPTFRSGLSA